MSNSFRPNSCPGETFLRIIIWACITNSLLAAIYTLIPGDEDSITKQFLHSIVGLTQLFICIYVLFFRSCNPVRIIRNT